LIFILGCGAICSSASATYSLEDKLKELESRLETKIDLLESKNRELEEKVTQLGTQLERNVSF
jgi:prefoldin subunit 5